MGFGFGPPIRPKPRTTGTREGASPCPRPVAGASALGRSEPARRPLRHRGCFTMRSCLFAGNQQRGHGETSWVGVIARAVCTASGPQVRGGRKTSESAILSPTLPLVGPSRTDADSDRGPLLVRGPSPCPGAEGNERRLYKIYWAPRDFMVRGSDLKRTLRLWRSGVNNFDLCYRQQTLCGPPGPVRSSRVASERSGSSRVGLARPGRVGPGVGPVCTAQGFFPSRHGVYLQLRKLELVAFQRRGMHAQRL